MRVKSYFNRVKKVIGKPDKRVTFDYVVKRYAVTKEQLKADMKNLRWTNEGGVIYFDLKQIRARYTVDVDKLSALAALEA
jgi:hypothetical protein